MLAAIPSYVRPILRTPSWCVPFSHSTSVICTVVPEFGATQLSLGASITEVSQYAAEKLYHDWWASLIGQGFVPTLQTSRGLPLMLAVAATWAMAKLYAKPTTTGSHLETLADGYTYFRRNATSEFALFVREAAWFTNPWNAYQAALAWEQAPWTYPNADFIPYLNDETLMVLPQRVRNFTE